MGGDKKNTKSIFALVLMLFLILGFKIYTKDILQFDFGDFLIGTYVILITVLMFDKKEKKEELEKTPKQQSFPLILEQYECPNCKLKFYINTEDTKENEIFACPNCNEDSTNKIRKFATIVEYIIPY